jgi:RNA polymerase sigma factor (sigma-70 family)
LEHTINALLEQLPQRQQLLLRLRFGMEDDTCYSLEAIGEKLGVSKERARQLEHQAMDKLQTLGAGLGLEDFLS